MAESGRRMPPATQPAAAPDEQQSTEIRMRRALGLGSGTGQNTPQQRPEQARARHRFVQDGGVPVVMLGQKAEPEIAQLRERIATLESQLEHERGAHANALRQLKETDVHRTALETRLAHADLTHKDGLEQERRLRLTAQEALQEALETAAPRRRVPAAARVAVPIGVAGHAHETTPDLAVPALAETAPSVGPVVVKRGRGRPRSTKLPEPKPVRWWTPSFRGKGKS